MTSRRPPSDGGSARTTVLPGSCAIIGRQLADVRTARGLSVEDLAARLLLSKAQVLGIEAADATPFYTPFYFLRGLRKYMAFAGVPEDLLDVTPPDDEAETVDPDALRLTLACDEPRSTRAGSRSSGLTWAVVTGAILVAVGVSSVLQSWPPAAGDAARSETLQLASLSPLPAQPLRVSTAAAAPVEAAPAQSGATSPGTGVQLSVGKATWVFVRLADDEVIEHRLAAGDTFEVGTLPVYLAIGTPETVDLRIAGRRVVIAPYVSGGQVRISRAQLAALGARRDPG